MFYFLPPLLLTVYFEFLGRWVSHKFKNMHLELYFPLGFFSFMAVLYPLSLLTIQGCFFKLFFLLVALCGSAGLFFIIRDFNKYDHHVNPICLVALIVMAGLFTWYSFNTTLGNLNGFDSTFYLNFVSTSMLQSSLNSQDIFLGGEQFVSLSYYSGQVYYYFASCLLYIAGKVASLLKIEFFNLQGYVWTFQTLFNLSLSAVLVEAFMRVKKNRILCLVMGIPLIFVFGKLYYHSVYGFFGNSYLVLVLSYVTYWLLEEKEKNWLILYVLLLSSCAFTSSGIYSLLFVLFGLFFFEKDKEKRIREYAFVPFLPLVNALSMEEEVLLALLNNQTLVLSIIVLLPIAVSLFLYFVAPIFVCFIEKKKGWKFVVVFFIALTFILSRFVSNGLLDFHGLLNSLSQLQDMSLDYFNFTYDITLVKLYKGLVLVLLAACLISDVKEKYIQFIWILILVFFNPFSCNIINEVVSVYYRSYAIFINPIALVYFFERIIDKLKIKPLQVGVSVLVALLFIVNIDFIHPIYYHYQHEPQEGYNVLYKMKDDELEVIRQLKANIDYLGQEKPYIITANTLTLSMIPQGKYLYARNCIESPYWSLAEKKLQEIFYEPEYLGDCLSKHPDYENMDRYLKEAEIDYLVVKKDVEYYDSINGYYSYLMYKVSEVTGVMPFYENESYVVFRFEY